MCRIGDEIDAASDGALTLPRSNARVLDLCMAPGGFTASVLKHTHHAVVCGITLRTHLGGHRLFRRPDSRVQMIFIDITMLHAELGVAEIPPGHGEVSNFSDMRSWYGKRFDLIFGDGQELRTHEPYIAEYRRPVEAIRLKVSQLILALQRIESGGTLIVLLHHLEIYETIKTLSVFDKIAQIQLFKPVTAHKMKASFYLIAKNVQPEHPKAVIAINEWKKTWKELTFPTLDRDGQGDPPQIASEIELQEEVSNLLELFGERIIELGEPIWQIQKDALATAKWRRQNTALERIGTGEASATRIDNAAVLVRDSEEGLGETGDSGDVHTAPALGETSNLHANDSAGSANVSVGMERLEIDD